MGGKGSQGQEEAALGIKLCDTLQRRGSLLKKAGGSSSCPGPGYVAVCPDLPVQGGAAQKIQCALSL